MYCNIMIIYILYDVIFWPNRNILKAMPPKCYFFEILLKEITEKMTECMLVSLYESIWVYTGLYEVIQEYNSFLSC